MNQIQNYILIIKKVEYKKYFNPDKEGIYIIKLKFNIYIKDCSFMFCNCYNIINIDLSSFQDTKNVNNMSYMFYYCNKLESLPDISEWDTKNVNDMSFMFDFCNSLQSLPDISKWDTKNVNNIDYIFVYSESLKKIPKKFIKDKKYIL